MFCHDADDIQAPIKKFQRQELDSLLFLGGVLVFIRGHFMWHTKDM